MEWLNELPPILIKILALLTMSALLIGFSMFFKNIKGIADAMNKKIDLLVMGQESTDYALDKVLPKNGKTYLEHKKEKKEELLRDYQYVNK